MNNNLHMHSEIKLMFFNFIIFMVSMMPDITKTLQIVLLSFSIVLTSMKIIEIYKQIKLRNKELKEKEKDEQNNI